MLKKRKASARSQSSQSGDTKTRDMMSWDTLPVVTHVKKTSPAKLPQQQHDHPRYRLHELLGSGGHGSVFRATDTLSGESVAIKIAKVPHAGAAAGVLARQQNELDILQSIRARCAENHVVCVRDHYTQADTGHVHLVIVMQHVPGIALHDARLTRAQLLSAATQLFVALRFLHSMGINHGDVKPANILWYNNQLTLVDFGLACRVHQCTGKGGTHKYIWPRLLHTEHPTQAMYRASDLYAAARTVLVVLDEAGVQFPDLHKIMVQVMTNPVNATAGRVVSRLRAVHFKL